MRTSRSVIREPFVQREHVRGDAFGGLCIRRHQRARPGKNRGRAVWRRRGVRNSAQNVRRDVFQFLCDLNGVAFRRQFFAVIVREIAVCRVIFRRVRSRHQRIEGDVMIRQHQTLGRKKLAGAAIDDHYGVLDTGTIRIVNVGDRNLQSPLLQLLQGKLAERVRQEQAFVAQDGNRYQTDKDQDGEQQHSRARIRRGHESFFLRCWVGSKFVEDVIRSPSRSENEGQRVECCNADLLVLCTRQILFWIHGLVVDAHFVMQVRTG
jgi:hypothetical protein